MSSKGLAFPIRLNGRGGLQLSSSNLNNERMGEIITLMLCTKKFERIMYPNLGCDLDIQLYENGDVSIQSLLQYEIAKSLSEDSRILIQPSDITFVNEESISYIIISCVVEGEKVNYKIPITDWR